jgi:hypothetical protein
MRSIAMLFAAVAGGALIGAAAYAAPSTNAPDAGNAQTDVGGSPPATSSAGATTSTPDKTAAGARSATGAGHDTAATAEGPAKSSPKHAKSYDFGQTDNGDLSAPTPSRDTSAGAGDSTPAGGH